MDLAHIRATLLSIILGAKGGEYKVTLALDEDEVTFTARVEKQVIGEGESFDYMGLDIVFGTFFCHNQQIVRQVVRAVFDFHAGKPQSFPIDLGRYYIGGAPRVSDTTGET